MQIGLISTLGGGVGRITSHLIQGLLKKEDVKIELFLVDSRLDYKIGQNSHVIQQYCPHLNSPLLSKMKSLFDLSIKAPLDDVIHCHYASYAASLKRYRGKLILTMHGFPRAEIETSLNYKFAYMFEQFCLSFLPDRVKIVTISQYCSDVIKERYGLETQVIYNGTDCSFFTPSCNRDLMKRRLGFPNKKVILYVGRLHPLKDPITLLEAYHEVTRRITDTILLMVGQGSLKDKILKLSSEYGLSIRMIDSTTDAGLLSLYQCADLFILPSLGEPFGVVLAEAMACGTPCLANTSGAPPEVLGMRDLLVEPANPKALAEMMIYLLQTPSEWHKVSEYLLERVKKKFSVEEMTDKYYELYRLTVK